jgi:hypothetical protein
MARWKKDPGPEDGDQRLITVFLWVPRLINGETRFFEKATIRQEYHGAWSLADEYWLDLEWVD